MKFSRAAPFGSNRPDKASIGIEYFNDLIADLYEVYVFIGIDIGQPRLEESDNPGLILARYRKICDASNRLVRKKRSLRIMNVFNALDGLDCSLGFRSLNVFIIKGE